MKGQGNNRYRMSENDYHRAFHCYPEEHLIKVEKLGVTVRIQAVGKGQPVFFVHGGPADGNIWYQLIPFMNEYTCILLDRPGCGFSESISYKYLSRQGLTDIVVSVIDSVLQYLQFNEAVFVSSSFGNYLVMLYALQKPEHIRKIIFEGCPASVEGGEIPQFMKLMLMPGMNWIFQKIPMTKLFFRKILSEMGHNYAIHENLIPEIFVEWYISLINDTYTMKNELSLIGKAYPHGKINPQFILHDYEIEKINLPALWLWGRNDTFGNIEICRRLNSKMRNSRYLFLDKSGHLPWIDNPESNAVAIKEFITA
jgi:pimeloyl-ACP methyl ester carboxylesterase